MWLTLGIPRRGCDAIQAGEHWRLAMARAIALRSDFTSTDLRRLARGSKDAAQARRLLALAVVYDGGSRGEPAFLAGQQRHQARPAPVRKHTAARCRPMRCYRQSRDRPARRRSLSVVPLARGSGGTLLSPGPRRQVGHRSAARCRPPTHVDYEHPRRLDQSVHRPLTVERPFDIARPGEGSRPSTWWKFWCGLDGD